ncbi:hypothetical protein CB1_000154016 [Camelus ferus]|nr:hypothetical protein CB1_000154016 [Camelus ferus]
MVQPVEFSPGQFPTKTAERCYSRVKEHGVGKRKSSYTFEQLEQVFGQGGWDAQPCQPVLINSSGLYQELESDGSTMEEYSQEDWGNHSQDLHGYPTDQELDEIPVTKRTLKIKQECSEEAQKRDIMQNIVQILESVQLKWELFQSWTDFSRLHLSNKLAIFGIGYNTRWKEDIRYHYAEISSQVPLGKRLREYFNSEKPEGRIIMTRVQKMNWKNVYYKFLEITISEARCLELHMEIDWIPIAHSKPTGGNVVQYLLPGGIPKSPGLYAIGYEECIERPPSPHMERRPLDPGKEGRVDMETLSAQASLQVEIEPTRIIYCYLGIAEVRTLQQCLFLHFQANTKTFSKDWVAPPSRAQLELHVPPGLTKLQAVEGAEVVLPVWYTLQGEVSSTKPKPWEVLTLMWFLEEEKGLMEQVLSHISGVTSSKTGASLVYSMPSRNVSLRLQGLKEKDSGPYLCSVNVQASQGKESRVHSSRTLELNVLVPPAPPSCHLRGVPRVGTNVTLGCQSPRSKPAAQYQWVRSPPSSQVFFAPALDAIRGSLSLKNLSISMSGVYICKAHNEVGSAQCNVTLEVSTGHGATVVAGAVVGTLVGLGLLAVLVILYHRRAKALEEPANDIKLLNLYPSSCPSSSDAPWTEGERDTGCGAGVCHNPATCFPTKTPGLAVEVEVPAEPLSVPLGKTAELTCSYSTSVGENFALEWSFVQPGRPISASQPILYFTNGQLYPTGSKAERASLLHNPPTGGVASLKLTDVRPSDTGTYLCHVNNPPDFYTNGLGLINLTVLDEVTGQLILTNLSLASAGTYRCLATNQMGSASCELTLSVTDPSKGRVAGALIGVLLGVLFLSVAVFCLRRFQKERRKKRKEIYGGSDLRLTMMLFLAQPLSPADLGQDLKREGSCVQNALEEVTQGPGPQG